jgi:dihydroneopterin aldolase
MDKVVIEGLVVLAHVGVSDVERTAIQRCRIDLELWTDLRAAGEADDLARTIDYGRVIETVKDVVATAAPKLLETLAEKMAAALLERFGGTDPGLVGRLRLRLVKLDPPVDVAVGGVGVEIERERAQGAGAGSRERAQGAGAGSRERAGFR